MRTRTVAGAASLLAACTSIAPLAGPVGAVSATTGSSRVESRHRCGADDVVLDEQSLVSPGGRPVGRIRLTVEPNGTSFCADVKIRPRWAAHSQVRYRLVVRAPLTEPARGGATEPARRPHLIGYGCTCYSAGVQATYTMTFIHDFCGGSRKFRVTAAAEGVLP